MEAGLIAKLELCTPYITQARRDLVEARWRCICEESCECLRCGRCGCECWELFGKANFLWHMSWMCFSPDLQHMHVLHAADIELDADKGRHQVQH